MKKRNQMLLGLSLLGLLCLAVGCGQPDYYKCSGVVMHEGKPMAHLQITFAPENPESVRPPISMSDSNGRFEMSSGREFGVPPGTYIVHIEDPVAADGRKTSTEPDYLYVIDRYSPMKSDLKYEADRHRTNFELVLEKREYTGPPVRKTEMRNAAADLISNP
jgi:hypothetical protein